MSHGRIPIWQHDHGDSHSDQDLDVSSGDSPAGKDPGKVTEILIESVNVTRAC